MFLYLWFCNSGNKVFPNNLNVLIAALVILSTSLMILCQVFLVGAVGGGNNGGIGLLSSC